jgi:hypothetical protein
MGMPHVGTRKYSYQAVPSTWKMITLSKRLGIISYIVKYVAEEVHYFTKIEVIMLNYLNKCGLYWSG